LLIPKQKKITQEEENSFPPRKHKYTLLKTSHPNFFWSINHNNKNKKRRTLGLTKDFMNIAIFYKEEDEKKYVLVTN
jgi:hypothetical protein